MAKETFIKVRTTHEDKARFQGLAAVCDMPLGQLIRETLERLEAEMVKRGADAGDS